MLEREHREAVRSLDVVQGKPETAEMAAVVAPGAKVVRAAAEPVVPRSVSWWTMATHWCRSLGAKSSVVWAEMVDEAAPVGLQPRVRAAALQV
jgi:hypothetical protein